MTKSIFSKSVFVLFLSSLFSWSALAAFPADFWPQFGQNAEWTVTGGNELSFVGNPGNSAMVATTFGNLGVPSFAGVRLTYDAYVSANGAKNLIVILGSNAGFPGTGILIVANIYQIQALKNFDYGAAVMLSSNASYYQNTAVIPGAYNAFIIDVSASGLITVTINGYQCPTTYQADINVLNAAGTFATFCPGFSPFLLKNLTVTKGASTKNYFYPVPAFTGSYYIDAVNGDDSGSGHTEGDAWKTFANVNSRVLAAGTKIMLKSGSVWNQRLEIRGAGTVNNWISVGAYGTGNKPKISLTNNANDIGLLICDLDKTTGTARMQDISYIEVRDIEISNTRLGIYYRTVTGTTNTGFRVSNVTFNNINCDPVMTAINSASNKDTEISNQLAAVKGNLQTIAGAADGGVREYVFPAAIFIGGQTMGNQTVSGTHTTVLTELEVYNCQFNEAIAGLMTVFYWPFISGGGSNIWRQLVNKVKMFNCTSTGVVNGAIAFDGVNGGGVADANGVMQPDANGWGLIKNVRVTMGASAPGRTWPHGTTGVIFCNSQKIVVDSCEFSEVLNQGNPDGCGFDFETNNDLVTIQNSKFINNDGHSVLIMNGGAFGGNTNLIFQNNLFAGNIKSGTSTTEFSLSSNSDGHSNVKFRNNMVFMRKKNRNNQNITLYDPSRTYFTQTFNDLYYLEPTASTISVNFLGQTYTYNAQANSVNAYFTVRDGARQSVECPTFFLGDAASFAWDITSIAWGATLKKAGIGTTNTSAGMNWQDIVYVDDAGDAVGKNEGIRSATYSLNTTGTWYYSLWLGTGATVGSSGSWNKSNAIGTIGSANYTSSLFTVQALGNPTGLSATRTSGTTAYLSWANAVDGAQNHEVMIVRKKITGTFTEPTQGVFYDPISNPLGVVFAGTATNWTDTSLDPNFAYQYKVYTRNNNYYSSGVRVYNTYSIAGGTTSISSLPTCATCDVQVASDGYLIFDQTRTYQSITVAAGGKLSITNAGAITGPLTLESNANGTATLVDEFSTPTVSATVKQYVTAGRNWYLSAPIQSAGYSLLNRGTGVVSWNEGAKNWDAVNAGTLVQGKGYVQVSTSTPSPTGTTGTLNFNGLTNSGTITLPLTRTESGITRGFNLVGNPYPSYINWQMVDATAGNISSSIWYRTKTSGGAYVFDSYNGLLNSATTLGATLVTNKIPPMQAFWVRVKTSAGGSISFNNAMRVHRDNDLNTFKAPAKSIQLPLLRLRVSSDLAADEALICLHPEATNMLDDYDTPKMSNNSSTIPEIYTQVGTEKLVINCFNDAMNDTEIPLGFSTKQPNSFLLAASELKNIDPNVRIVLKDKLLHTEFDLTSGEAYSFQSTVVNDANRFAIVFKTTSGTEPEMTYNVHVFVDSNNQMVINQDASFGQESRIRISNALGQLILSTETTQKQTVIHQKLDSGLYFVLVENNGNRIVKKIVIR